MPHRLKLLVLLPCALSACSKSIVSTPPARCSSLIPKAWGEGVPGYPIPSGDATADWQKAFVGQSGQLSKANGRTQDVIAIVSGCEALLNEARR